MIVLAIKNPIVLVVAYSVLMPLTALIVRRKKIYYTIAPLAVFVVFCLFTETAGAITTHFSIRNLCLSHIYKVVEAGLLSAVFYRAIENKIFKKIILWGTVAFVITSVIISLFVQPLRDYPTIASTIEGVLMPAWILLYFYNVYDSPQPVQLKKDPIFWLSCGALLYFAGQFILHGTYNYLLENNRTLIHTLDNIRLIFIEVFYISQTVAICLPKPK